MSMQNTWTKSPYRDVQQDPYCCCTSCGGEVYRLPRSLLERVLCGDCEEEKRACEKI